MQIQVTLMTTGPERCRVIRALHGQHDETVSGGPQSPVVAAAIRQWNEEGRVENPDAITVHVESAAERAASIDAVMREAKRQAEEEAAAAKAKKKKAKKKK